MTYLQDLTTEQREELREKSRISREAKKLAGQNLKKDFEDLSYWKSLASEAGVRMPSSHIPSSDTKYIRRVASKLGIDLKQYLEYSGVTNLKALWKLNPDWSVVGEVGCILEYWEEKNETPTKKERLISLKNTCFITSTQN